MPDQFGNMTEEDEINLAQNFPVQTQNFTPVDIMEPDPMDQPVYPDQPVEPAPVVPIAPQPEPVDPLPPAAAAPVADPGMPVPDDQLPAGLPPGYQPENQNTINALQGQKDLAAQQGQLMQDEAGFQTELESEQARIQSESAEEMQLLAQQRDAEVNEAIQHRKGLVEQYDKMAIKDYWADKPTWTKIASLIGMTLGAYGAGLTGGKNTAGKNTALQILNKAMDDDYARQKAAIDKQFRLIQQARGDTAELRKAYSDQMEALKFKEVSKLKKVKQQVLLKAGGLRSEKARLNAQQLAGALDLKIAGAQDDALSKVNQLLVRQQFEKNRENARLAQIAAKRNQQNPQTTQGKLQKLSGEERKRLDSATMGLDAVNAMDAALRKDVNTFSLVGDNDFTMAASRWEDAIGRMQSGGAINNEEGKRFRAMAPIWTDSKEIQKKKIEWMRSEMSKRIGNLGFSPDEFTQPQSPAQTPALPQQASEADKKALEWARKNPGEKANAIIERVRRKYGR